MNDLVDILSHRTQLRDWRFEHKADITEMTKDELITLLYTHPICFNEIFCERTVNNIYLDTFNYCLYSDNLNGLSNRVKWRIRWYGDVLGVIVNPYLELKIKKGNLGYKLRYSLHIKTWESLFDHSAYIALMKQQDIPDYLKEQLLALQPTLINRYQRRYFLSFDTLYRSTVDHHLSYHSPSLGYKALGHVSDSIIFELKYQENAPHPESLFTVFPFRKTRYSKYATGIESII